MKTDNQTQELPNLPALPKKRGRPSSGQAVSSAARQAAYRDRQRRSSFYNVDKLASEVRIDDGLPSKYYLEGVARSVAVCDNEMARIWFAKLGKSLGVL